MNKLVSGAIGVPIEITGNKIYLPDILDLKGKRIKHIDFCDQVTTTSTGKTCISASDSSVYLNVIEQNTKDLKLKSLSFDLLNLSKNNGNRLFINKIIDFPNSFIEWYGVAQQGTCLFLVFWFDEPKIMNRLIETGKTVVDAFEVQIYSASVRKILFGENRTLFNRKFQNIMLYAPDTPGITPKGNVNIQKSYAYSSFLTLQKDNYQYIRNVPLYVFLQNSVTFPLRLQNIQFDFTNSFIEVAPDLVLTPGQSWAFNVEMDDND